MAGLNLYVDHTTPPLIEYPPYNNTLLVSDNRAYELEIYDYCIFLDI